MNRESSPDAGSEGRTPPRIVLPPGETPGERRRRWVRRGLRALVLAGAGVLIYYLGGAEVLDRISPSSAVFGGRAQGEAVAADTGSAARGGDAPSDALGESAIDPGVARYRNRADGLSAALRRFREGEAAFDRGRLGCSGLARRYGEVDRAMVDLARAYLGVRDRLGPADRSLYDRSMARADSAGRSFDASGCERAP